MQTPQGRDLRDILLASLREVEDVDWQPEILNQAELTPLARDNHST